MGASYALIHYSKLGQLQTLLITQFQDADTLENILPLKRQYVHYQGTYSSMCIQKPHILGLKFSNFVTAEVATTSTWKYTPGHKPQTQKITIPQTILTVEQKSKGPICAQGQMIFQLQKF